MSEHAPAYDVFVSYSREDEKAAFLLCAELDKAKTTYYLDQTSGKVGDEWLNQIKSAIDCVRYFALLYSKDANESTYVKQEVECAAAVSRRGWILLDKSQPRTEIKKLLGRINASIAYNGDRDSAICNFALSIAQALWKPAVLRRGPAQLSHDKCPYRPYRPYEKSDTLFGRESEIAEVTESIYQAVEDEAVPALNEKKRLMFVYGPSGTGKSSLMASGVVPRLAREKKAYTVGPFRLSEMKKSFEGYAAEAKGEPCVIAIDQFEEAWADDDQQIPEATLKQIKNITTALNAFPRLAIVLSFREEYLAKVQKLCGAEEKRWNHQPVRGLGKGDADDCIRGPAAELQIFYEDSLAAALVKTLAKRADHIGPAGDIQVYVEPVELQIVCERLWNVVDEGIQEIHRSHLLHVCEKMRLETAGLNEDNIEQLAAIFFKHVTQDFLVDAVKEISNTPVAIASNYNKPERIYFALRQFVSDTKKRISIKTRPAGGRMWVGRLPMSIVDELTARHLLKKAVNIPGEESFELVHDRLVESIFDRKLEMELIYAVNSLESEMTKVKQKRDGRLKGWFEDYESTVKDMTEFKKFHGLNSEEAEFIFRSALAYGRNKQGDFDDWVKTIREQHPTVLERVLRDAFSSYHSNKNVLINGAVLLRNKEFQRELGSEKLLTLMKDLKEVVCRESVPDDALEELCFTLATCLKPKVDVTMCGHLSEVLPDQGHFAALSPQILLWMRDKANMDAGGCFAQRWKALSVGRRASLTLQLYCLRFRKAFLRMAFIVFISTLTTAAGAALMFASWGYFGSSFTQSSAVSGFGQGLFHGVFGGLIWGSFLSLTTLCYWLILRGRLIEKTASHWLGGVALSSLAGLLGGIVLAVMVLNVDAANTMKAAGWLKLDGQELLSDAFKETGGGWILPIYGLFLGFGVGWSMLSLYHDRVFRTFVRKQKSLEDGKQFFLWLREILWRVLIKSGPMAAGMALAAVLVVALFSGKTLDCYPYQWDRPARCDLTQIQKADPPDSPAQDAKLNPIALQRQRIAPLEWRAAGMAAIIFAGAYSMTVGYLLALLTIRFGVAVPEDQRFLVANEVNTESIQAGVPAASEPS
jgi:hypothetical protein